METHEFKYELGLAAEAIVSQFKGIIVSRSEHITGCDTYTLKPRGLDKDGNTHEALMFDENEIKITGKGVVAAMKKAAGDTVVNPKKKGGPRRNVIKKY